jgi:hypothetical protein
MGRNWMSIVVSETSSSLRGTSMGPVTETRTFVWPGLAVMEKVPDVQRADPSARESGFVVMPFDRYIFCCYCWCAVTNKALSVGMLWVTSWFDDLRISRFSISLPFAVVNNSRH